MHMTEDQIEALVTTYNQHRPRRSERDMGRSWCTQDETDMLQVIIEDLEPIGFTDFRYDGSKEEYQSFIICNYGPMICRIDISTADRKYYNRQPLHRQGEATAELDYLREFPGYTLVRGWAPISLCMWGWERSGGPFRMREIKIDRLLLGR